ncbi:MAG: hypothetical protein FJX57_04695 [Alphaproteobacteria bacterium]|nr:hypothetical protein [Alphaproteobacteria bacterium]
MLILGLHSGYHDACAALHDDYRLVSAVALERMTRVKVDGGRLPWEAADECLAIAGTSRRDVDAVALSRGPFPFDYFTHFTGGRLVAGKARALVGRSKMKSMERECVRYGRTDSEAMFDTARFLAENGLRAGIPVRFYNHHTAHALPCLFHTDWPDALLFTADAGGDNIQYSHHLFRDGRLETLYGGDQGLLETMRIDSLGFAYGFATQALGFRIARHEGKVTGLAAMGRPALAPALAAHFSCDEHGTLRSDFATYKDMQRFILDWAKDQAREDVAASVQQVLEDFVLQSVGRLIARHGARRLGVSGGVFANVKLNQRLAEELPIEELFVYPAMSDAGLAAGGILQFLLARDGLATWLEARHHLESLYYGRDYGTAIDDALAAAPGMNRVAGDPAREAARLIHEGWIVAIYARGMEYGPRALGARSILAAPTDARINTELNDRLERSEFMPFAPVVRVQDARVIFDLPAASLYAARFMTITCNVREAWRARIPAVVHVDGTARPQVIERAANPLYYDILSAYAEASGIPVLINTSFNVHEEPIINTPAECLKALMQKRIDAVVTERGVYWRDRPALAVATSPGEPNASGMQRFL